MRPRACAWSAGRRASPRRSPRSGRTGSPRRRCRSRSAPCSTPARPASASESPRWPPPPGPAPSRVDSTPFGGLSDCPLAAEGHCGMRILLVDDQPALRELLRVTFESADVTVDEAASASEALARVRDVLPDVIILDLKMPVISGTDLCVW